MPCIPMLVFTPKLDDLIRDQQIFNIGCARAAKCSMTILRKHSEAQPTEGRYFPKLDTYK